MAVQKQQKAPADISERRQEDRPVAGSYFLSLELEHVRCFAEKQSLDLSDGDGRPVRWTLLLGENGTGKTTVLQLLAAFEDIPLQIRVNANAEAQSNGPARTSRAMLREFFKPGSFLRTLSGSHFHAATNYVCPARLDSKDKPHASSMALQFDGLNLESESPANVPKPLCYGYGAGRRLSSHSTLSQPEQADATESLFAEDVNLLNAEEWLLRLDYSASKSSGSPEIKKLQAERLNLVKDVLKNILPDVGDIRFTSPSKQRPNPTVEFKTPYGWVLLRQLGYGYRTMIAWIVDFASRMVDRYRDSADPLAEPAVVLVDEIDLHLHPRWQRELIGFLTERFPNTQFIATAHSPLIVQAAGDANIALLRREGDHVVIENDPETIHGWSIDQILTSDLYGLKTARPPDLEDLLQRRKQLLTQPELTQTDRKQLAEIESKIVPLPPGESFEHAKTIELIRETAELLKRKKDHKP